MGLVREWDRGFYCIRVGTVLDADKAQDIAMVEPGDEHGGWSLKIKGEFSSVESPN